MPRHGGCTEIPGASDCLCQLIEVLTGAAPYEGEPGNRGDAWVPREMEVREIHRAQYLGSAFRSQRSRGGLTTECTRRLLHWNASPPTLGTLGIRSVRPFCRIAFLLVLQVLPFGSAAAATSAAQDSLLAGPQLESLLDQTVSAAAKYEQRCTEAPASVTIVTSEEIQAYGYQTIAEVLNGLRGFYLSNDRNYTYVGVRGFGRPSDYNNRILLLLDGHALNDAIYGGAYVGWEQLGLDLDMVERIEVVRGPGAALYGNNAMFAVVNVVTKQARQVSGARVGVLAGSHFAVGGAANGGQVFENGAEILFGGQLLKTDGPEIYFHEFDTPQTSGGIASGLDWERGYGFTGVLRQGNLRFEGFLSSRRKGIPTASWGIDFNDDRAQTYDIRGFGEVKYDRALGARQHLMWRTYFDHYHYDGVWPYDGQESWDSSDGRWVGGEVHYRLDLGSNNRFWVGTELQNYMRADYQSWDAETVYTRGNHPFSSMALYVGEEYQPRTDILLSLGLRWDDTSVSESSLTPRAGVIYSPLSATALKLLYGGAFRAANVNERTYADELAGYKANPEIGPETIETGEIVLEQRLGGHVAGSLSVYENRVHGLIESVLDPTDSLFTYANYGDVRARGVELELRGRWTRGFGGYWNYAYQNAKEGDTDLWVTNSPQHLMKLGITAPIAPWTMLALESAYESARLTMGRESCPGFFRSNMRLSSRLGHGLQEHAEVWLRVNNLFNAAYAVPGGYEHVQPTIPQPRRTIYLGVDTRW